MLDSSEGYLSITAHSARDLKNVELAGKQDPYILFSLDISNPKAFQKTFVDHNGGRNPEWNQNFQVPYRGESELFIELMDEEKGVDEVIGFAAIPLSQVFNAPGGSLYGSFEVYTVNGQSAGRVILSIAAPGASTEENGDPVEGESVVNEAHARRMKKMRTKAIAGDVGTAVLGGALAIGAGFLANKLYKEYKQREEGDNAPAWEAGKEFESGDDVEYEGQTYVCIQSHTSEESWTPDSTASLWKPL